MKKWTCHKVRRLNWEQKQTCCFPSCTSAVVPCEPHIRTVTNVYISNITCHIKVGRKHPLPSSMILRLQPHCILCLWLYIINTFCLFHPFSTTNKHFDRTCLILIIRPLDTSLETLQMLHCRIGKPHNGQDSWGRLNHTHGKRRFKKSTTADQRANESFRSWGW